MNIVTEVKQWQAIRKTLQGCAIGFVPTMGHLHRGHMSLCERSMQDNEVSVVSIFVNPVQFDQPQDFTSYPSTLEQDQEQLYAIGIDYLFLPDTIAIFPDHYQVQVVETEMSALLEGEYRPGHLTGMMSVVLKLFNLVQPHRAYFGEKDYQQLLLIKKMVQAFFLPIDVVACETIRDDDGLASSSRHSRLSSLQRQQAVHFAKLLQSAESPEQIVKHLQCLGFTVDYIVDKWNRRLGAVWLDDIRLIDNIPLEKS